MNIALVAKDSRLSVAVRSRINEGILDFFFRGFALNHLTIKI